MLLMGCYFCGAPIKGRGYQFHFLEGVPTIFGERRDRIVMNPASGGTKVSADLCAHCGHTIMSVVSRLRQNVGDGLSSMPGLSAAFRPEVENHSVGNVIRGMVDSKMSVPLAAETVTAS